MIAVRDRIAVALFVAGFLAALVQPVLGLDGSAFGRGFENVAVARNLAHTGEFKDPFGIPTGPTAHVAPLYPGVLALAFKLGGESAGTVIVLLLFNAALLGLSAALLPSISRHVYDRSGPGIAGAILLILSSREYLQFDGFCSAALLITASLALLGGSLVWSAIWSGAALLANPASLLILPFVALRHGGRFAVKALLLALAVCAPWILRNWLVLGAPYPIRDNLGLELYVSNNDLASAELVTNRALTVMHPTSDAKEANAVAVAGEGMYGRLRLRDALHWANAHPARGLKLTLERIFYYWFPSPREGWQAYPYCLITILAAIGAWRCRANPRILLFLAGAIAYSLLFALIQADVRYRLPSLWTQALVAGEVLAAMAAAIRWNPGSSSNGIRNRHDGRDQALRRVSGLNARPQGDAF